MKGKIALLVAFVVLGVGSFAFISRRGEATEEIEYRYAKVERGNLVRSISATGQVVALTKVDVKSKAGGKVVQLLVDEGSIVKRGDLIAVIDPADTQAVVEQANADLMSANARAVVAEKTYELQRAQGRSAVKEAQAALDAARIRLNRMKLQSERQPEITQSQIRTAEAALNEALNQQERLMKVEIPARRREFQANYDRSKAEFDTAEADLKRQQQLLEKGYVAGSVVERARAQSEAARASLALADQRLRTLDQELQADIRAVEASVERARAALNQAKANASETKIREVDVAEAQQAVRTAEINLQQAKDNLIQIEVRRNESLAAKAATVRNRVSLQNAQVQLDSTTVVAPRDGVVTRKYLEEGTIIPPGMSTFAQGTSLVEISDVTQLFVECAVDEADIANVRVGQDVRITTDAFRGRTLNGKVTRVNPAALTEQNITAIKVRVSVQTDPKVPILPGMNATCEFITLDKKGVLLLPSQAVSHDEGKPTVRVKGPGGKPVSREIQIGEEGNDGVEVLSGLSEGEEVVTAEINLAELREIQRKMTEAQEGGGLAGGGPRGPNQRRPAATGSNGGARGGGGGGAAGGARPGGPGR